MASKTSQTEENSQRKKEQESLRKYLQLQAHKVYKTRKKEQQVLVLPELQLICNCTNSPKSQELPISDPWIPSTAYTAAQHYQRLPVSG